MSEQCEHKHGVMIPQTDLDGNYVKPEFMICTNCRLVLKPITLETKSEQK